ncbi:patatin-like phospholipase family protein [Falsiroseomonas sp.]|uniref:patatin-like phospholipase family protein n=1 Tax=Falsiroseomonas sp. TaxID=2870721 RepID=UPI0034A45ACC
MRPPGHPSPCLPRRPAGRRSLFQAAAGLSLAAALPACAIPTRLPPVPRGQAGRATVLGLPNERFRPGLAQDQAAIEQEFIAAQARQRRHLGFGPTAILPTLDMLAISGGGENGAFGAGLLNGWTRHGSRPVFDLVTGVSTGALTAPFAFIGPSQDEALRRVYTEISPERVLVRRWLTAAIFDDGLADTAPLFATIAEYLDEAMLTAIARTHDEGRLLLIASTDLDAQTPVIWNIGAIAKSGHPHALDTIRRILLASAAIPGAFPPVMFDVTIDGRPHQEMHVDGGTFVQAFLYPGVVTRERRQRLARHQRINPARAWIIRNGRLDAEWAAVDRRAITIAGRAVSTLTAASGLNDVVRMYFTTQRDEIDYNLAFIRPDFTGVYTEPFEQSYMRELYDYGEALGRRGYEWSKVPPIG